MCGIAGYYYTAGTKVSDTELMLKILQGQRHRGPDDTGLRGFSLISAVSKEFGVAETERVDEVYEGMLGFNRLSIMDLSLNGHQPMCSPDEQVILTLNGEVYNAFDFKDELLADGIRFKSTSDTEVVLFLYMKYGFEGMVARLNGMFAIVVIDLHQQKVFLTRDRFGIKPLYLFQKPGIFAFASEIKSFLPLPEFEAELDGRLLDEYLLFRSNVNKSLFKHVVSIEPGTYVVYSPHAELKTHRYFDIENYHRPEGVGNRSPLIDIQEQLKASVKRQLMSDVKLGCQLSGGVDSSLVAYFAKHVKEDDLLETVSIVLADPRFSEEAYMDFVTDRLGLVSHKFELDAPYYLQSFRKAIWHFEGPLNHPNTIGIYLLSQRAKEYVTVLLSGEGADEVFGGYGRFAQVNYPYHFRHLLSALKKNRAEPGAFLTRYFSGSYRAILSSAFITPALAGTLKPDFIFDRAMGERRAIYEGLTGSVFDKQIKYEIKTYLPDLLARQDKMSMAHSIENRVPFLDNELVEKSFTIPESQMIRQGVSDSNLKIVLKKLAAEIFGNAFAFRDKQGFGIPLRSFFREREFAQYIGDEILPGIVNRKIFNASPIQKWTNNLERISSEELDALWIMISFEVWAKEFKVA